MILFQSGLSTGVVRKYGDALGDLMPAYSPSVGASFMFELDSAVKSGARVFFDSGMYGVDARAREAVRKSGGCLWDYYETDEFHKHMDRYAAFVKGNPTTVGLYANCDAIGNPELSWVHQRYLEWTHGINPVPVIHQGTCMTWLRRYVLSGRYEVIGLGWLTSAAGSESFYRWLDQAFDVICPPPSRMPLAKVHGFGMCNPKFMLRYPWWSTDGSSWLKQSAYGHVLVPYTKNGDWDFTREPLGVAVTPECEDVHKAAKRHITTMGPAAREELNRWLGELGLTLEGVSASQDDRITANLGYFNRFKAALPPHPQPFVPIMSHRSFGL